MTAYRRTRVPGATYFFTVAVQQRGATVLTDCIDELRGAFVSTWRDKPFRCDAVVVLPDHLHAVWTLPRGDADYSVRWGALKSRFTRAVRVRMGLNPILRSASNARKGDAGIWQRRFWEHRIRDEADYVAHVRYCWTNPVKHGLVEYALDWPYSSVHRDLRAGMVDPEWCVVDGSFGEPM